MDPLSALLAAIVAGAIEAAKPTAAQLVKDTYNGLKGLIARKLGKAATQISSVEEKPESAGRQQVLKEELEEASVDKDAEVMQAVQALVDALKQHAPASVSNITNIESGGGLLNTGTINVGQGATFVGRDQTINNITVSSIDQGVELAATLRQTLSAMVLAPEPEALNQMTAVLDEISKLYQFIDSEMTQYLSLTLDVDLKHDRQALLNLEGGKIIARAGDARGHCSKIEQIYKGFLEPWLKKKLSANQLEQIDRSFWVFGDSDYNMVDVIESIADWLSKRAKCTLDLVDKGDLEGARTMVREARLDAIDTRQKLARIVSEMQAQFMRATLQGR